MSFTLPTVGAEAMTRGYRPAADGYDEMADATGAIRPRWATLLAEIDRLGPGELAARWAGAQELIHENGVSYNVHGDAQGMERPWPLSPLPVLLDAGEWQVLSAGLVQRAHLLELVLEDLHGPQNLVKEGLLPAALVFGHPGLLPAYRGLPVAGSRWLPFCATDVVRTPDGTFQVLSDRTQVPTGAGYTLENRIIVSRALPEAFRACHVERLAPFFRTLRSTIAGLAPRNKDNPRVAMLTLGPADPTYFEQAFLAQYLGYPLVHGGDLTVRSGRVYLKTLGGLHGVDVILRRMADESCDPLELRPEGLVGVPGLVEAVRERSVAIANPLGSGVAGAAALLPYLPAICRHLLGEELRLGSVQTLWCGDEAVLPRVLESLPRLVIKPAFELANTQPLFAGQLDAHQLAALRARIQAAPSAFVAQERVTLATTPALAEGSLQPRSWVLRTYLVATADAHAVMPGGLTRFSPAAEGLEVSIQRGGRSKDTWVMSGAPVPGFSLLPAASTKVQLSRGGSDLPSRVADNLFWLGRYAERAEGLARLARGIVVRLNDQTAAGLPAGELAPLVRALVAESSLTELKVPDAAAGVVPSWEAAVVAALSDDRERGTLRSTLRSLHRLAQECRDRISSDTFRVLMTIETDLPAAGVDQLAGVLPRLNQLVIMLSALSGLVGDSMTRGQAWRFLDVGRRLERADQLATLLRCTLVPPCGREGPLLEAVLDTADSGMTYRRRYLNRLDPAAVLDLLLTDETNPRSVLFQVSVLAEQIAALPVDPKSAVRTREQRLVLKLRSDLQLADVEALAALDGSGVRRALDESLEQLLKSLPVLSDALSASYLSHAVVSRQLGGPEVLP